MGQFRDVMDLTCRTVMLHCETGKAGARD